VVFGQFKDSVPSEASPPSPVVNRDNVPGYYVEPADIKAYYMLGLRPDAFNDWGNPPYRASGKI